MRNRRNKRSNKKNINILKIIELFVVALILYTLVFIMNNLKDQTSNISESDISISETDVTNTLDNTVENHITQNTLIDSENSISKKSDITFTMAATGDIMCHNTIYWDAYNKSSSKYDFSYIFDDIKYYIQTADIAIGNLETTLAGSKVGYSSYPTFNTPESLAKNLKKVGFDVLSTANNHSLDKGFNGIKSTLKYLDKADLSHTGTYSSKEDQQKILIKNVKGVKIAFLSFTYGTNGIAIPKGKEFCINLNDKETILEQLNLAKEQEPDMICVSMHWGTEYQTIPNSTQKKLADFLFENGADIILGNHPHVPQSMEERTIKLEDGTEKEVFVIYSLGNFLADQGYKYTRNSAILNIKITKHSETGKISIDKATYTPIYIYKDRSKSIQKFKLLDIPSTISAYDEGTDTSIGKTMYNTLKTELKNIKNIIGKEIK